MFKRNLERLTGAGLLALALAAALLLSSAGPIVSGSGSAAADVDSTAKALRVTLYDTRGNPICTRASYSAASSAPFAAPAGTTPFFALYGSSSTVLRVQKICVTAPTLTAVAYQAINLEKYSTAISGGTSADLTFTPHDSASAASTASICKTYTAAPTTGTRVGIIGGRRSLFQATTAAAAGQPETMTFEWDFDPSRGIEPIVLRGTAEGIGLAFAAAPASAVTLDVEIVVTESSS